MTDSKTVVEDLAAWLTRVWDDDERLARMATEGPWILAWHRDGRILGIDAHDGYDEVITTGDVNCMGHCLGGTSTIEATDEDWRFIGANHPASVLARIAAGRKILALHFEEWQASKTEPAVTYPVCHTCWGEWPCETVRLLASPYAEREGFRPEWLVERQGVEQ